MIPALPILSLVGLFLYTISIFLLLTPMLWSRTTATWVLYGAGLFLGLISFAFNIFYPILAFIFLLFAIISGILLVLGMFDCNFLGIASRCFSLFDRFGVDDDCDECCYEKEDECDCDECRRDHCDKCGSEDRKDKKDDKVVGTRGCGCGKPLANVTRGAPEPKSRSCACGQKFPTLGQRNGKVSTTKSNTLQTKKSTVPNPLAKTTTIKRAAPKGKVGFTAHANASVLFEKPVSTSKTTHVNLSKEEQKPSSFLGTKKQSSVQKVNLIDLNSKGNDEKHSDRDDVSQHSEADSVDDVLEVNVVESALSRRGHEDIRKEPHELYDKGNDSIYDDDLSTDFA